MMEDGNVPMGLPASSADGDLERTPLVHLLVHASEKHLTGSVVFDQGRGRSCAITLVEGTVTKARTSEPVSHLGRILLELGLVTEAQLDETRTARTKRGGLHGQIFVEAGILSEMQVMEALERQLERKLDYMFTLPPSTTFAYFANFDVLAAFGGTQELHVNMRRALWRGICLAPPLPHVNAALERIGQARLRPIGGAPLTQFGFSEQLLEHIRRMQAVPASIAEATKGPVPHPETVRLAVYCLLISKVLEPLETSFFSANYASVSGAAGTALAAAHREQASRGALGWPSAQFRAAEDSAVKAARLEAAQLSGQPSAVGYGAATIMMSQPVPSPAQALTPEGETGGHVERRDEIRGTAMTIDALDYFQMLGLAPEAPEAEVQEAFDRLSLRWAPERLPATLDDVRGDCARVFERLCEARDVLCNTARREAYMKLMKEGGATPEAQAYLSRVRSAESTFQKAEECALLGQWKEAAALCQDAHEKVPTQSTYLTFLAWAQAMQRPPSDVEAAKTSTALLDRALGIDPQNARAYFYRGMLYRRLGETPSAIADLRRALELDPASPAATELPVWLATEKAPYANEVSPTPPSPKRPSFLSKLFRKDGES